MQTDQWGNFLRRGQRTELNIRKRRQRSGGNGREKTQTKAELARETMGGKFSFLHDLVGWVGLDTDLADFTEGAGQG
jgi:hypothetical protein